MSNSKAERPRYAARLNAFKSRTPGGGSIVDMLEVASKVEGLDAADLNFPDHFTDHTPMALKAELDGRGLALNGLAMRYYSVPEFALGAFTNPDPGIRQQAIDLTKRGIDALAAMDGRLMTLWLGQDGFDYAFQADYRSLWDASIDALEQVARHDPNVDISLEYKPNEPRAFALMPDVATTLLGVKEAGLPNIGVTLDFAHVLYADEMPAHAASLVHRHSRLMGVHLNDGYGKRDDGLMVGTVHPVQTVELFVELERIGYDGVIYFDTFPDLSGLDPLEEARTNVLIVERLRQIAASLAQDDALAAAIARQDATSSQRIIAAALFRGD